MPFKIRIVFVLIFFYLISIMLMVGKNANAQKLPTLKSTNDTTYSAQVRIHTSILDFPLPDAEVKFSMIDTINQSKQLIKQGTTNQNGELIIDSLPILKNFVGISELEEPKNQENKIKISNNGTGSAHSILIKSNQKLSKEGLILGMDGRIVANINLFFDPTSLTYQGFWNGEGMKTGVYVFYVQSQNGHVAEKINHFANHPGEQNQIYFDAENQFPSLNRNLKEVTMEKAKYEVEISSEVGETFNQLVYIQEQATHEFDFSINHLPIPNAEIQGVVTINRTIQAPNAVMSWSSLLSNEGFVTYTDTNGFYSKNDIPVAIDGQFTNPEWDRYYLTINIGDTITFKVDPVLVFSGELVTRDFNINILGE